MEQDNHTGKSTAEFFPEEVQGEIGMLEFTVEESL